MTKIAFLGVFCKKNAYFPAFLMTQPGFFDGESLVQKNSRRKAYFDRKFTPFFRLKPTLFTRVHVLFTNKVYNVIQL